MLPNENLGVSTIILCAFLLVSSPQVGLTLTVGCVVHTGRAVVQHNIVAAS